MYSLITPGRIIAAVIVLAIFGWLANGHFDALLTDAAHQTFGHTLDTLNNPLRAYDSYR